jgi:hypothetical protein
MKSNPFSIVGQRIGRVDIFIGGSIAISAIQRFADRFLPDGYTVTPGYGVWRSQLEQQITVTVFLPWDAPAHLARPNTVPGIDFVLMPAERDAIYETAQNIAENAAMEFGQESVLWSVVAVERAELTTPQAGYRRNG